MLAPDSGKLADACPKASLGAGDLEQADYWDADHRGEAYAPPDCVCPVWIGVVVVAVPLVVLDREVQDQLGIRHERKTVDKQWI